MTTAIWHNDHTGQSVKRSLLAYDHWPLGISHLVGVGGDQGHPDRPRAVRSWEKVNQSAPSSRSRLMPRPAPTWPPWPTRSWAEGRACCTWSGDIQPGSGSGLLKRSEECLPHWSRRTLPCRVKVRFSAPLVARRVVLRSVPARVRRALACGSRPAPRRSQGTRSWSYRRSWSCRLRLGELGSGLGRRCWRPLGAFHLSSPLVGSMPDVSRCEACTRWYLRYELAVSPQRIRRQSPTANDQIGVSVQFSALCQVLRPQPCGSDDAVQLAWRARAVRRLRARRSSSDSPPHTPASWRYSMAHLKQVWTTSQRRQMTFASSTCRSAGPVFPIGKNSSGSLSRQTASLRQVTGIGLLWSRSWGSASC